MPDVASASAEVTPAVVAVAAPASAEVTPAVVAVAAPAAAVVADPAAAVAAAAAASDPTPKDWATLRAEYAKGDEKLLKRLERYSSQQAVLDALVAAQNKIASGQTRTVLPEKPTAEQLAEYRKENGIPEKASEYDIRLPEGAVVSDADKAMVEDFTKVAHAANMNPGQVKQTLGWFFENQQREIEQARNAEAVQREKNVEELRSEWGSEYKLNLNIVDNFLKTAPDGLADQLLGARLADGTPFANDVKVLRWLANTARELNPTATVVPGSGTGAADTIASEKMAIEAKMGDKNSEYWKGPSAAAMQKRYRDLLDVEEKMKGRG